MPVELLESETEVAEVPETIPAGAVPQSAVKTADQTADQKAVRQPKSIWREIFEGHEDMLGWTPD